MTFAAAINVRVDTPIMISQFTVIPKTVPKCRNPEHEISLDSKNGRLPPNVRAVADATRAAQGV